MNFTTKSILLGSMATIFISAINLNAVDIIALLLLLASSTVNG